MNINLEKICDMEFDGIDHSDYPDYADSYLSSASFDLGNGNFRELTEDELEYINDKEREFLYEKLWNYLH